MAIRVPMSSCANGAGRNDDADVPEAAGPPERFYKTQHTE